jgi:hypothetical protein
LDAIGGVHERRQIPFFKPWSFIKLDLLRNWVTSKAIVPHLSEHFGRFILGQEYLHLFSDVEETVVFAGDRNRSEPLAIPVEVPA